MSDVDFATADPAFAAAPGLVEDEALAPAAPVVLDLGAASDSAGEETRPQVARWYAVQVASSCEKKVKATLEQRAVTLGVDSRILEIEIPRR